METVSGGQTSPAADEDSPLPVTASPITPATLAGLLAEHAYVYRVRSRKTGNGASETFEEEVTPARDILSSVLAYKTWPGLAPLRGVIGAPVLRRDGTLLQRPGYDPATGLYLASKVALPPVPERPTAEQVNGARDFLLNRFLRDFPWSSAADRANYVALLVTPILRHFTRSLTPFALIDATMPASGKSILTGGPGMLYGQRVMPWGYTEEELRKSITAVLAEQVGVVVWDNLAEGTVIDSATLALLVTACACGPTGSSARPATSPPSTTGYGWPPATTSKSVATWHRAPSGCTWTPTCPGPSNATKAASGSRTLTSGSPRPPTSSPFCGTCW